MTKVINYLSEAFEELKSNVTWPNGLKCNVYNYCWLFSFFAWHLGVDELFQKL
jgi:preprotein translocase subunit SecE